MIALILGGGAGSRLYPLTEQRSKPAVSIAGKYRLVDIPISNCLNSGVRRMFVLTQYNSASLNRHIKNAYNFDLFNSSFVDILAAEQTPRSELWFQGTADAVRQSLHHLKNHQFEHILILSGDQLYQMNFQDFLRDHLSKNADVSIATIPVNMEDATGFGIMKVGEDGMIQNFVEKPTKDVLPEWRSSVSDKNKAEGKEFLASMGIYLFNKQVLFDLLNENPDAIDFGKEIMPDAILGNRRVASFAYNGYWTDIGTIRSFLEAGLKLTDPIPEFNLFDEMEKIYTNARILPPAKYFRTNLNMAIIAEGSIIHNAIIERSVIGLRSRIEDNSFVSHSIVMGNDYYETLDQIEALKGKMPHMGIGRDCHIENAIIDKNCRIGNNVFIKGSDTLANVETDTYCIREGIVVLKKGAIIPDGTVIGEESKVELTEIQKNNVYDRQEDFS